MPFAYIGKAYTPAEFAAYVASYDFGSIPPDYIVLHHTAIPAASWAPAGAPGDFWDAGDAQRSPAEIKAMRLSRMAGVKNYYQNTLGWDAGPHLWIDDRYIYLMTPMRDIGIHAMWGNSFTRNGKLHYSIGIEVVGNYTNVQWPPAVQANVRAAVQLLQKRLGTFSLDYMYADPASKPGRAQNSKGEWYCPHPERLRFGGISSHRDFNKAECPGNAITEDFYMSVLRGPVPAVAPAADGLPTPLPYVGTTQTISAATFKAVLVDHQSPLAPWADVLYRWCVDVDIAADVALAQCHAESNFGKDEPAFSLGNCFNLKERFGFLANADGFSDFFGPTRAGGYWLGWRWGLDWLKRYPSIGLYTLEQIAPVFVYGDPQADASAYIRKIRATVADIRKRES